MLGQGHQFVWACQEALSCFDEWIHHCSEADIKENFKRLAEIRKHLDCALREATEIINGKEGA